MKLDLKDEAISIINKDIKIKFFANKNFWIIYNNKIIVCKYRRSSNGKFTNDGDFDKMGWFPHAINQTYYLYQGDFEFKNKGGKDECYFCHHNIEIIYRYELKYSSWEVVICLNCYQNLPKEKENLYKWEYADTFKSKFDIED